MHPADREYTADHLWVRAEGSEAAIGITAVAKERMCPLEAVRFPAVGTSVARGMSFASLETAKALIEMLAPASGHVTAINDEVAAHPERLCEDPYGSWIVRIALATPDELSALLSNAEYAALAPPSRPKRDRPKRRPPAPAPKPVPDIRPERRPLPVTALPETTPVDPAATLSVSWTARLQDTRLRGGAEAFGDRDYSGGSYFAWGEREIVLAGNQRFVWLDIRSTRVIGGKPRLVLQDAKRGMQTFLLEEAGRGRLLLNSSAYSWSGR